MTRKSIASKLAQRIANMSVIPYMQKFILPRLKSNEDFTIRIYINANVKKELYEC